MMEAPSIAPPTDTKRRILDAAEKVFADYGFAAAGMKTIAAEAGVAQALLHYHFASKEGLYAKVVERRTAAINGARRADLERLISAGRGDDLRAILDILFRPALSEEGGGINYARILAAMVAGPERDQALVKKHYDDIAHVFIDAIAEAVGPHDRSAAAYGYSYAIAVLVAQMGHTDRPERLAREAGGPPDPERTLRRLVTFAAAGIRDLIAEEADRKAAT